MYRLGRTKLIAMARMPAARHEAKKLPARPQVDKILKWIEAESRVN